VKKARRTPLKKLRTTLPDPITGAREKNNYFSEMCSGSEAGSYSRLEDFCVTQL
jgi:hypothetical protein